MEGSRAAVNHWGLLGLLMYEMMGGGPLAFPSVCVSTLSCCTLCDAYQREEQPPPGAVVGGQGRVAQQRGEVPAAELFFWCVDMQK